MSSSVREREKRPRDAHLVRAGDEVQILNKHLEDFSDSLAIPRVVAVDADHPVSIATSVRYTPADTYRKNQDRLTNCLLLPACS